MHNDACFTKYLPWQTHHSYIYIVFVIITKFSFTTCREIPLWQILYNSTLDKTELLWWVRTYILTKYKGNEYSYSKVQVFNFCQVLIWLPVLNFCNNNDTVSNTIEKYFYYNIILYILYQKRQYYRKQYHMVQFHVNW